MLCWVSVEKRTNTSATKRRKLQWKWNLVRGKSSNHRPINELGVTNLVENSIIIVPHASQHEDLSVTHSPNQTHLTVPMLLWRWSSRSVIRDVVMHFTVKAVQARSKRTVLLYSSNNNNSGRQLISKTTSTFKLSSEYLIISMFCNPNPPGRRGNVEGRTRKRTDTMKNIHSHLILLCTQTDYSLDTNWISSSRLHQSTFIITQLTELYKLCLGLLVCNWAW